MASSLYYDINADDMHYSNFIQEIESYANTSKTEIFVFKIPKSDLSSEEYEHDGCFMLMVPGHKIVLVNAYAQEQDFEDYCTDVDEITNYLFTKYAYRSELGRFSVWRKGLIVKKNLAELNDIAIFLSEVKAHSPQERKNANLLVSLCSGSINDIGRVKKDVPTNLLDNVKQKIQLFDADQTRFIYQELDKKVIKVQGLSGTGKTELLLHKLKELYQKPEKYKIFVTCHNRILADTLHKRIPEFFNFMKVQSHNSSLKIQYMA